MMGSVVPGVAAGAGIVGVVDVETGAADAAVAEVVPGAVDAVVEAYAEPETADVASMTMASMAEGSKTALTHWSRLSLKSL